MVSISWLAPDCCRQEREDMAKLKTALLDLGSRWTKQVDGKGNEGRGVGEEGNGSKRAGFLLSPESRSLGGMFWKLELPRQWRFWILVRCCERMSWHIP